MTKGADQPKVDPALAATETRSEVDSREPFSPGASSTPPASIGRFAIQQKLGQGGMGVVYAAHDNTLDRRVAIKVLRQNRQIGHHARTRMLREAQSMARLSHPNVIHVYEVGEHDGQVFLAMEYINGQTLRQWQAVESRAWRDILRAYIQAGLGLAAAHNAGIVHRDFKPDNALVDTDERVRVGDFGLAHMRESDGDRPLTAQDDPDQAIEENQLTQTGAIMGTPAYMSPEQHLGEPATATSDQFSLCVALFEALYGAHPFAGDSMDAIRRKVLTGDIATAPETSDIPRHIKHTLIRGLATDPDERYPDVASLLTQLQAALVVRSRRLELLVLLALVLVVGSWMLLRSAADPTPPCKRAAERIDGVWSDTAKNALRQSFLATERSHISETLTRTNQVLDAYARKWTTMRIEACEATKVRGEQSEALLDLRMQCLDRRLAQMDALVKVFSDEPTAEVVDEAVKAAYGLPALDQCADGKALSATIPPPTDKARRAKLAALQTDLARVNALTLANRHQQAMAEAEQIVTLAREFGHAPFFAEAAYLSGTLSERLGASDKAENTLMEAAQASARAGNDRLSAEIWIELIQTIGHSQARFEEAAWLGQVADAELLRTGDPPLLRARLDTNLGTVAYTAGRAAEAYHQHSKALDIRRNKLDPAHPDVIESLTNVGVMLYSQGQFAEASDINRQALEVGTQALGANHPNVARAHLNLGLSLVPLRKYDEARTNYQLALQIITQVYGDAHPAAGILHINFGELAWLQQDAHKALDEYSKALTIMEGAFDDEHPHLAYPLTGLGQAQIHLGQIPQAIERLERAKTLREAGEAEPAERATTQFYLQRALWLSGQQTAIVRAQAMAAFEVYNNNPFHIEAESALMKQWLDSLPARP